jgi:hypothetical protein
MIFYAGSIPLFSLILSAVHVACLHYSAYLSLKLLLVTSTFGATIWLVQASLWTACELSKVPVNGLGSPLTTRLWCPQYPFNNDDSIFKPPLAIFKDTLAWVLMAAFLATVAVVRVIIQQEAAGKRMDRFHELVEITTLAPNPKSNQEARKRTDFDPPLRYKTADQLQLGASIPRPYSSMNLRKDPDQPPSIKILKIEV